MQDTMLEIIDNYGYIGIAFLIFIENIFPPIPSEAVLAFGGFMTTISGMKIPIVVISATIGATLGAVVLYLVGRILPVEKIEKLFGGKFGKIMHLKREDIKKAGTWFEKYDKKTVFLCRFIPVVRSLISIPAGTSKMRILPFLAMTVAGTAIWNTVLVVIGAVAGDAWETAVSNFDIYFKVILAAVIGAAVIIAMFFYLRKKKQDTNSFSQFPKD